MIVDSNPINFAKPKKVDSRSQFDLSHHHLLTARFGEYTPNACKFVVPSDKRFRFNDKINLRTYTLKAPLMQNLNYNKDNFIVPLSAVLPINWDKVYTNPVNGDDVPSNNSANTVIYGLIYKLSALYSNVDTVLHGEYSDVQKFNAFLRGWLTLERFLSNGSLLAHLNCHLSNNFRCNDDEGYSVSFDKVSDVLFNAIKSAISNDDLGFTINIDNMLYRVVSRSQYIGVNSLDLTFDECLEILRYADSFYVGSISSSSLIADLVNKFDDFTVSWTSDDREVPFNYLFACAYHIICEHYFTNDHVDNVYSVEKYRDVMKYYLYSAYGTWTVNTHTFLYNGVRTDYDILSGHFVGDILGSFWSVGHLTLLANLPSYAFIKNIFGFCNSLKYVDYFVGSRTNPLAVGNTNVAVVGGQVSVIDINQRTQYQRFLNAVNRFGRKSKSYIEGLFGVDEGYDYHNPAFVSHTSDSVFVSEVENTGNSQFSNDKAFSSTMRSNSNRFEFEVDINRPSVVMSLISFDIQRSYNDSIDRMFHAEDRFDMFIPQLQFVGDQKVYRSEKDGILPDYNQNYGYQLRDSHFKQSYNYSSGGFKEYLPGYSFADNNSKVLSYFGIQFVSSMMIRSYGFELDPFYVSLDNRSLAGYFHFIIDSWNNIDVSRPMVVSPSIL